MPTTTSDQPLTVPVDADPADGPQAFLDYSATVIPRLNKKYTTAANRAANALTPVENDLTSLSTENRFDVYDGTNYVSLHTRSFHSYARRNVDGTAGSGLVNNSTALVNDPLLFGALDSGGIYQWEATIFYDSSTTADIKFAFTTPAFSAMRWSITGLATTATTNEGDVRIQTTNLSGTAIPLGGIGVSTIITARIEGYITTTAAGNLQLQFAQQTLDATNTSIRQGSYLRTWRVV